jgi:hypothetical protein
MSDTDKIIGAAIGGLIGLKLLDTGLKIIDKNRKKIKNDKWF